MEEPTITLLEGEIVTQKVTVAEKKKRNNADQDQSIANEISEAGAFYLVIEADPQISALLAPRGVDSTEIAYAKTLHTAAQLAFSARQSAMAADSSMAHRANTNFLIVKKAYADFREICRARITDKHLQLGLGLGGTAPIDRQKLITLARSSYEAAKKPEIQALISRSGYDIAALDALLAQIDTLENDIVLSREADGAAKHATVQRNAAVKALRAWVSATKRIARRALRERTDLLGKLGL